MILSFTIPPFKRLLTVSMLKILYASYVEPMGRKIYTVHLLASEIIIIRL